jgi:hypothetical protein
MLDGVCRGLLGKLPSSNPDGIGISLASDSEAQKAKKLEEKQDTQKFLIFNLKLLITNFLFCIFAETRLREVF